MTSHLFPASSVKPHLERRASFELVRQNNYVRFCARALYSANRAFARPVLEIYMFSNPYEQTGRDFWIRLPTRMQRIGKKCPPKQQNDILCRLIVLHLLPFSRLIKLERNLVVTRFRYLSEFRMNFRMHLAIKQINGCHEPQLDAFFLLDARCQTSRRERSFESRFLRLVNFRRS